MDKVLYWIVKLTALPVEWIYYKRKIYYYSKNQNRTIKGGALIVSNHTAIMDYPFYMYTFKRAVVRPVTADIIYRRAKILAWFLNKMGAIRVDRNVYDFAFVEKATKIINKGGKVLIFPESRISTLDPYDLLEFKPSFVYIALNSNCPIIPCYTNGCYGKKGKRAEVVIGEKIYLRDLYDESKSEKENIEYLSKYVRDYIKKLGEKLNEKEE